MNLRLLRVDGDGERTIGLLLVNSHFQCYTLEDTVRLGAKVYGKTAIPEGVYRVTVSLSARFKTELPLLLQVPGFEGIRIHAGNTEADTDGCVLVGVERGSDSLIQSRVALDFLLRKIQAAERAGETIRIAVENRF